MRIIAKVDANQAEIVADLRAIGCTVLHLHMVGHGCPDIAVGFRGQNYLFELKDGDKPPSRRRLTADEQAWHEKWRGQVAVITTFDEALECLTRNL